MLFTTLILSGKGSYTFKDFSEPEEPFRSSGLDKESAISLFKGPDNKCHFVGLIASVELSVTSSAVVAQK